MTSAHHEPLPPDLLDELLSARLDGEFDDAARDLGMEPDVAAARVDATPGAADRYASLGAARTLSRDAAVEPLDDVSRRRLVTRAADDTIGPELHHTHHRARAWVVRAGGIAVAAAAVVGVIVALGHTSSSTSKASSAAAPTVAPPASPTSKKPPNQIENAADLRAFAADLLRAQSPRANQLDTNATGGAAAAVSQTTSAGKYLSTPPHELDCQSTIAKQFKLTNGAPAAHASVTYQQRQAGVFVFQRADGGNVVVLYDPNGCALLITQTAK